MTLHDLIAEFEAEFAAVVARFRSHPAVQAAAAAVQPPPVRTPEVHNDAQPAPMAPSIDYAALKDLTPYEIETLKFPNGLPVAWSWTEWTKVSGKPDPTVTAQPTGTAPDRWATTFPWTNAGGDPLYFNKATRFTVPLPPGYSGKVRVDFGETPAAGPVPLKLKLNEQLFEGPTVRDAFLEIDASAPFEFNAEPLDANGNPVTGQGGSLVLHHTP